MRFRGTFATIMSLTAHNRICLHVFLARIALQWGNNKAHVDKYALIHQMIDVFGKSVAFM